MQKVSATQKQTSSAQQIKPQQPKHNMTVVELSTPHVKLPGVQKYTPEDLKLMVEKAKQFPAVHEGFYLKLQSYDFQVDEWELETGNSQPHSDESKLNLKPKTAKTAEQRRAELAKKSKEARLGMDDKLDKERNPTFKRPVTATARKSVKNVKNDDDEEAKQNNIVESQPEVNSEQEEDNENDNNNNNDEQDNKDEENNDNGQDNEDGGKKSEVLGEEDNQDKNKKQNSRQQIESKKTIQNKVNIQTQKSTRVKVEEEQEEDINSYKIQMISKEKQKNQQYKQQFKKNLQKEDIMNDGDDDEDEQNNSFEKMSVSQAYDNQSNTSQSRVLNKQKQMAKGKGPYKSDVANMMSSMFSEISGFDTDI